MTNDKLTQLANELLAKMKKAKNEANNLKMNPSDKGLRFVHIENKEYVNPEFLSFAKQLEIVELREFLMQYEEVHEEELKKIFSLYQTEFEFLSEVMGLIPNFIHEIKKHDEKYIAYSFIGIQQNIQQEI